MHAQRAGTADITTSFVSPPEPRTIGRVTRGQQMIAGQFLFAGLVVDQSELSIWSLASDNPLVTDEIHGCVWLDDLAAVGTEDARLRAQAWVFDWITQFGDGHDAGWQPNVTGRRLIRWINHALFILRGLDDTQTATFYQSLARQTLFLGERWRVIPPGLDQFEALTGMIYAGLSLEGMQQHVPPAIAALASACDKQIAPDGGIASRNPEALLEILMMLNLTWQAISAARQSIPTAIVHAIERIAPTLRALRHADAHLARFHGGGSGVEGRLDEALAASGVKTLPQPGLHMGYARITGGRTSLVADAAAPTGGPSSADAHASTLAFELTSARRPLIVSCGHGACFGADWRRASRATPSHSTMMLDGVSSSRLSPPDENIISDELLIARPSLVQCQIGEPAGTRKLDMSHNGYQADHGLTHTRTLALSVDGRHLQGEDLLETQGPSDEAIHDAGCQNGDLTFSLRFHLHPDVMAEMQSADLGVLLTLKSGEVWNLRHEGSAEISLSPSVYLEKGRLKPRATQQVVLSGRAMSYATRVRWSLAKAQDTPRAVRDLVQADPMDP